MIIKDARHGYRALVMKGPLKVILVTITMWSFLFGMFGHPLDTWAAKIPGELTSVGSDRGGGPDLSGNEPKELNISTFTIPEHLGTVRDAWIPENFALATSPQTIVIHIQDAHCNYDGQMKISEIVGYVNKEYGIKSVNLEGGAKNYDLSPLTAITEAEIRQRVSDYFVRNGRLNGAEYFAANNPAKVQLWGIEDTQLYIANLGVYREALKYKRDIDKYMSTLGHILTLLKVKIYPKELLELDAKFIQYKAGNLDFKDYLSYLVAKAREKRLDIKKFASIYDLDKTLEEETKIDFKKANSEREVLVEMIRKKLSNRALEDLVAKLAEFKSGRLSQKDFYDYLADKAKSVNVDMRDYTELSNYVTYIALYSSIDKMKTMGEISELETVLKGTMFENQTQRKLDTLSKNLALLKNIFNISLSKDDYRYFINNRASFDISNYVVFIKKEAPLYRIDAKLDEGLAMLDTYRDAVAEFYEYSLKRDEAFLRNMKYDKARGYNDSAMQIAVMVTGGFHTENLAEHFRKNNIAYVSIMPNFRNNAGYKAPYMDLLAGQETDIEKAIDTAASSMQIYSYLTELGEEVDGEHAVYRFKLAIAILSVLERPGVSACVVKVREGGLAVTFRAQKDDNGYVTTVDRPEKPRRLSEREFNELAGDITVNNLRDGPIEITSTAATTTSLSPATQEYIAGLKAKGAVTLEMIETLKTAEEIYDAIKNLAPTIIDILNHDAHTYIISPAPQADYAKTVEWANTLRRALGKNGVNIQAGYYNIGQLDGRSGMLSEVDKVLPDFLDRVLEQLRAQGKATDRLCIRVQPEQHDALMQHLEQWERIAALPESEKTAVMARIRVEMVDIGATEHLNPAPDLFTDMLAMEFDRYSQNDYPRESMPEPLPDQLGMMLRLTTDNITAEMVTREELANTMNRIFNGMALRIKPINWKSIDEWKDRNNAVVTAV